MGFIYNGYYAADFHEYDIRGVYKKEIDEYFAKKLGRSVVLHLRGKKIVVGYDGRLSSPKLFEAVSKGVVEQGAKVLDIGMVSTPCFYYAIKVLKADGGIMITASHDPKNYNGFKICGKNAVGMSKGEGLLDIEGIFIDDMFPKVKPGSIQKKEVKRFPHQTLGTIFHFTFFAYSLYPSNAFCSSLSSKINNPLKCFVGNFCHERSLCMQCRH